MCKCGSTLTGFKNATTGSMWHISGTICMIIKPNISNFAANCFLYISKAKTKISFILFIQKVRIWRPSSKRHQQILLKFITINLWKRARIERHKLFIFLRDIMSLSLNKEFSNFCTLDMGYGVDAFDVK